MRKRFVEKLVNCMASGTSVLTINHWTKVSENSSPTQENRIFMNPYIYINHNPIYSNLRYLKFQLKIFSNLNHIHKPKFNIHTVQKKPIPKNPFRSFFAFTASSINGFVDLIDCVILFIFHHHSTLIKTNNPNI